MAFRDSSTGSGGLDGTAGFMIKMPGTPHSTQLPDWKSFTEFRCFPAPREGGWHPLRNSIEFDDFGPAVEAERACRKMGVYEQFTYITRIPGAQGDDPTTKLCKALIQTADDSPHDIPREWCEWTKGGPGRAAKVNKVQTCIFMQGAAITLRGKLCKNRITQKPEPMFPVLFMGSLSLYMTFSRMGNTRVESVQIPAQVPLSDTEEGRLASDALMAQAFTLGDWCSPEHGRVLRVAKAEDKPNERPHYDIQMLAEKPLPEAMQNRVRGLWTPWNQLLRYHTAEQQISYLKRAFPAEVLDFALGRSEYEGLLPDGVRGSWQRLQQKMAGAYTGGLPDAAKQQVAQSEQQPQAPVAPEQPAPPAADDGWGSSDVASSDSAQKGPAMPDTPAEFSGAAPAGGQPAPSPATQAAPATPANAVRGGSIDPAKLAETLDMLNPPQGGEQGNAGE